MKVKFLLTGTIIEEICKPLYFLSTYITTRTWCSPLPVCNNCYTLLPFAEQYVTILLQSVPRMATLSNKKKSLLHSVAIRGRYVTICYIPSRYIPCLITAPVFRW
jgi:hypothetical protein